MLARGKMRTDSRLISSKYARLIWKLFPETGFAKIAGSIVVWQIGHHQKRTILNIVPVPVVLAEEKP
jgi:hypothetical protein